MKMWALSCPAARQVCAKLSGARVAHRRVNNDRFNKKRSWSYSGFACFICIVLAMLSFADVCGFASCMVWFGGAATLATMFGVHAGPGPAVIADHATMEIFRHAFLPWVGHIAQTQGFWHRQDDIVCPYECFQKWCFPTTMGFFLLKLIILGCFGGTPIFGNTHMSIWFTFDALWIQCFPWHHGLQPTISAIHNSADPWIFAMISCCHVACAPCHMGCGCGLAGWSHMLAWRDHLWDLLFTTTSWQPPVLGCHLHLSKMLSWSRSRCGYQCCGRDLGFGWMWAKYLSRV